MLQRYIMTASLGNTEHRFGENQLHSLEPKRRHFLTQQYLSAVAVASLNYDLIYPKTGLRQIWQNSNLRPTSL